MTRGREPTPAVSVPHRSVLAATGCGVSGLSEYPVRGEDSGLGNVARRGGGCDPR
jgi:hypothetical protein